MYDRCQCNESYYVFPDIDSGLPFESHDCRCAIDENLFIHSDTLRDRRCDPFPEACHPDCKFCSGTGAANQCEHCADDLELHGLAPTTCDCHDMHCPYPDVHRHAEACGCYDDCYYWDRVSHECELCHEGCDWCRDGNIFTCENCKDGWFMQPDADICLPYCPSGWAEDVSGCSNNGGLA